jgi:hypothetical protein
MCPAGKAVPYSAPGHCPDLTHGTDYPCYDKDRIMMKYDVTQSGKEIRCLKVQFKTNVSETCYTSVMRYDEGNTHNRLICMIRLLAGRCRVQTYSRSSSDSEAHPATY